MGFRIITLYTVNTPYEDEVSGWEKSVSDLDLPYFIYQEKSRDSWGRNAQLKALCIKKAFDQFPKDNIVWVDIDARIYKYPNFFDEVKTDISCNIFSDNIDTNQLCSGTIFFRNIDRVKFFVDKWIKLNAKQVTKYGDQDNLHTILKEAMSNKEITWYCLPQSYVKIFDRKSHQAADNIIVHYQASRRYKKKI